MMNHTQRTLFLLAFLTSLLLACGPKNGTPEEPTKVQILQPTPISQFPSVEITNDEGGAVAITGEVNYTNLFFTAGVAEPIIILEDQAGFVDRDRNFIFPPDSQVLGQITSDFYTSPFTYSLALPMVPKGSLRDVDQDGEEDTGLMIFAVAYWTNIWGDPYLEKRDQYGGGWSGAYASTLISDDRDTYLEVYGGKYIIYAPDNQQGFPSSFGEDEELFTSDDPIVQVPQGWTVVDLNTDPFIFDRSTEPEIELLEPESTALDDFSEMGYTEAFNAMLEKIRTEYAFTNYKGIDWNALADEFYPLFGQAESARNPTLYSQALRDFLWSIPDGHVGLSFSLLASQFRTEVAGGLGIAIQELDDDRVIVYYLLENSRADNAGIEFGAEILAINGKSIGDAISENVPWSSPFSTDHAMRLEQLRYAIRFPIGTEVEIEYKNPGAAATSARLIVSPEFESYNFSSPFASTTGIELPVEFELLDSGFGYVKITDFFDNEVLTIQLWERMIQDLIEGDVPGLIIDLRMNGGGSGYLADQMAAYFFDDELITGNTSYYDNSTGEFQSDPGDQDTFFLPREDLRYHGNLVALVGPSCASACEFFAYNLTLQGRATIIGQYPTAGLGGSIEKFIMPEEVEVTFTIGRAIDADGNIHIEGVGVEPDVRVPVNEATVYAVYLNHEDVVLDRGIEVVSTPRGAGITPEGPPRIGSDEEVQTALQSAPLLDDLALEIYEDMLFEPSTLIYNVPLGRSREVLWAALWCTSPEMLNQNWENITIVMTLDGENIPLNRFLTGDAPSGGQICRFYVTALFDWPIGEHVLITEMIFSAQLDDGVQDQLFAPGSRLYEYHVYVNE